MMHFMPTTLLISKVCPDGVETTTFAMLAGACITVHAQNVDCPPTLWPVSPRIVMQCARHRQLRRADQLERWGAAAW